MEQKKQKKKQKKQDQSLSRSLVVIPNVERTSEAVAMIMKKHNAMKDSQKHLGISKR